MGRVASCAAAAAGGSGGALGSGPLKKTLVGGRGEGRGAGGGVIAARAK